MVDTCWHHNVGLNTGLFAGWVLLYMRLSLIPEFQSLDPGWVELKSLYQYQLDGKQTRLGIWIPSGNQAWLAGNPLIDIVRWFSQVWNRSFGDINHRHVWWHRVRSKRLILNVEWLDVSTLIISRVHFVGYWNLVLHHALHCLACVDWYWSIPFRSEWIESSHPNEYQLTVWPVFWNVNGRGAGLGQTQPLQISIESVFVLEYIYVRLYTYIYTYAH